MTMKRILLVLILMSIVSCSHVSNIKIAISKGSGSKNYEQYSNWLRSVDDDVTVVDLYGLSYHEALVALEDCDGLVLSGGPDVHPAYFGKSYDSVRCSIDSFRDTLEFELIKKTEFLQVPILAICRGAQIINVAYGGSLIVDIPEDIESSILHQIPNKDAYHNISVTEGSLLHSISGTLSDTVNSNHHQSVDKLADRFVIVATSQDGIIEAFENKNKFLPYLLAVQWHPERLDPNSRFSRPIAESFLNEVRKNKNNQKVNK